MQTQTAIQNARIARGLPAIAKMVASQLKVNCYYDAGTVPYANKDGIHLPKNMSACGNDRDVVLLNSYLDHEAAHIRYSTFETIGRCKTPFEKTLLNIFEDVRIERLIGLAFPGCKINLAAASKILDCDVKPTKDDPASLLTGFFLTNLRKEVLNHAMNHDYLFKAAVEDMLGANLTARIYLIALESAFEDSTDGVYDRVAEIVALMKQEAKNQQQPQSANGSDASKEADAANGPDASKEADAANGPDASKEADAANGPDASNEADAANGPDASNEADAANGSDASKEADAANGSDASKEADAANGPDASNEADAANGSDASKEADAANGPDVPEGAFQSLLEALEGEGSDEHAKAMAEALKSLCAKPGEPVVEDIILQEADVDAPGPFRTNEASSGVRRVASKLDHLLWSIANNEPYAASSGKLKTSRLTSVVTVKQTKVFDRLDENDGFDTAVQLLGDFSGSMDAYEPGTARFIATNGCAIVAEACERYEGISCAFSAFDDYIYPIKRFHEKWSRVGGRISSIDAGLNTSMAAAHVFGVGELAARREKRKIMLLLTDGKPNNFPAVAASVHDAAMNGIETRFVLIGKMVTRETFVSEIPHATFVAHAESMEEIPAAILDALKGGKGLM